MSSKPSSDPCFFGTSHLLFSSLFYSKPFLCFFAKPNSILASGYSNFPLLPPGFADPQIFGYLAHLSGNDSPYLRNGFSTSTQLLPTPGSRALSNPPLPLLTLIHSSYPNLNLYNIFSIFSHCFASSKNISSMRSRLLSCLLLQPQCLE